MKIKLFSSDLWLVAVIVAVAGVLVAMMAPNFVKARSTGWGHNSCVVNMKLIEGAIDTWALEDKLPEGTAVDTSELFGPDKYMRVKPECPAGGDYIYNRVGDPVQVKCPNAATLTDHVWPPTK